MGGGGRGYAALPGGSVPTSPASFSTKDRWIIYQQVKAIWSVTLQRFELTLVRHGHTPDYSTFVPGPRAPCLVRYRRRLREGAGRALVEAAPVRP
jgi:hypothetical protein